MKIAKRNQNSTKIFLQFLNYRYIHSEKHNTRVFLSSSIQHYWASIFLTRVASRALPLLHYFFARRFEY